MKIYNREDSDSERINGLEVFVSDDATGTVQTKCGGTISGQTRSTAGTPIELDCDATGRYIRIVKDGSAGEGLDGAITLCEVELYGEAAKG